MFKFLSKKWFLPLVIGFGMAATFFLFFAFRYEQKTQKAYINTILKNANSSDNITKILTAMQLTHLQLKQDSVKTMGLILTPLEELFTAPLSQFILTKDGACGGNTLVLAQLLNAMNFDIRIAHMKAYDVYGGHIVLEVNYNNKWIVLDPLYNLAFKNTDSSFASFTEIGSNWNYFKKQLPPNYDTNYKYEGVRYTNWKKIPILGSVAKATVSLFAGKETSTHFSIRKYFLQPKKTLFYLSLSFLVYFILLFINKKFIHFSVKKFFAKK